MSSNVLTPQRLKRLTTASSRRRRRTVHVAAHKRRIPRRPLDRPLVVDARWLEIERLIVAISKTLDRDGSQALRSAQREPASKVANLLVDLFT